MSDLFRQHTEREPPQYNQDEGENVQRTAEARHLTTDTSTEPFGGHFLRSNIRAPTMGTSRPRNTFLTGRVEDPNASIPAGEGNQNEEQHGGHGIPIGREDGQEEGLSHNKDSSSTSSTSASDRDSDRDNEDEQTPTRPTTSNRTQTSQQAGVRFLGDNSFYIPPEGSIPRTSPPHHPHLPTHC